MGGRIKALFLAFLKNFLVGWVKKNKGLKIGVY